MKILAFGIARDIVGDFELTLDIAPNSTVENLKQQLVQRFPDFQKLASLRLAVNAEYADDTHILQPNDEVAIIPPVSGG